MDFFREHCWLFFISHFSHFKDIIRSTFSLSLWQTTIQLVSLFKFHCTILKYIFMTKNNFFNTFYLHAQCLTSLETNSQSGMCSLTISKHVQDWPWVSDDECFRVLHMSMNCLSQWMILFFVWTCSIPFFLFLFPIKVFWIVLCGVIKTCFLFRIKVYIKISWINLNCFSNNGMIQIYSCIFDI